MVTQSPKPTSSPPTTGVRSFVRSIEKASSARRRFGQLDGTKKMLRVPLFDDEMLTSYCARLAAANLTTATDLSLDMGVTFQNVIDGAERAIDALAEYSRVPVARLRSAAVVTSGRTLNLQGEPLTWQNYSRTRLRFCPGCFRDDDRSKDRMPGTRRYIRRSWALRFLRTCARHQLKMVDLGASPLHPPRNQDFIENLEELYEEVEEAIVSPTARQPSDFENFLLRRLEGIRCDGELLDELPLELAALVCTLIGVAALHGPKAREEAHDDDQLWEASQTGFEYLAGGVAGMHSFQDLMHRSISAVRCDIGGQKIYGNFYVRLKDREDPALDRLKCEIHTYAVEVLPLSGDSEVFGRPEVTRYVSEKQLRREFGHRPGHMRKMAVAMGFLSSSEIDAGAMPRDVAVRISELISDAVLPREAAEMLSVRIVNFNDLRRAGIFSPVLSSGNGVDAHERFSRTAVTEFLSGLRSIAAYPSDGLMRPILRACKMTAIRLGDMVALILQGRLSKVGWDADKEGLSAILIDPREASAALAPTGPKKLTITEMKERLKTSNETAYALVRGGYLNSSMGRSHAHNHPLRLISQEDADAFEKKYVSFLTAEKDLGISRSTLRKALKNAGLQTAFPLDEVRVSFYVRAELEAAIRVIEGAD
ncbi:hypothetical protein ELH17_08130 [Rhizobium ruizarguesonis]|nr:hypothetical protein ELH17_08130 [Rhizobium ruizarguesonis]